MLTKTLNWLLQGLSRNDSELFSLAAADDTVIFSMVVVLCDVHASLAEVVADILETIIAACQHFDDLIATSGCYNSVSWSDCWDDILNYSHGQFVVDTLDTELLCSLLALLTDPLHVYRAIFVDGSLEVLRPLYHVCVLNAVLWLTWYLLHCAQGVRSLRRQCAQHALVAGVFPRNDDSALATKRFWATVDKHDTLKRVHHRVYPTTRLNII